MRDLVILFVHIIATLARLLGPGGIRSLVAESVSVRRQKPIVGDSCSRESKNYREVEVLKSPGHLSPPQHQTLIRASSKGSASTKRLFRQPAASRIDDVSHPCVGMKPKGLTGPAWKKQVASSVRLS